MSALRVFVPLLFVFGGIALAVSEAKASAKKKKVDEAFDLGLDKEEGPNGPLPPPPGESSRAIPKNPITQTLFNTWWAQTEYGEAGVPGFWAYEVEDPPSGLDWLGPFPFLQLAVNPNVAIATKDGALWYWDNGWHPAPPLANDYDNWYNTIRK